MKKKVNEFKFLKSHPQFVLIWCLHDPHHEATGWPKVIQPGSIAIPCKQNKPSKMEAKNEVLDKRKKPK